MRWQWTSGRLFWGCLATAAAGLAALDLLLPPDMTRYEDASIEVHAADGPLLRAFLSRDDKWRLRTAYADVDRRYVEFLLAYEDKRFGLHHGVSASAALRAAWQWASSGHVISGASTLTMQTARLLEPGRGGIAGKAVQVLRALQLERRYSKAEILSIYLTLAPYGGNIEGARAASLAYFGKEPRNLTAAEAALLVVLPQSPERTRPDASPARAKAARDKVLLRVAAQGLLPEDALAEALASEVPAQRRAMPFVAPRFSQRLASMHGGPDAKIVSTLNSNLQRTAEALAAREAAYMPDAASLAFIVVHNPSREIRAYVGGVDFWGAGGQIDLGRAVRSPGSTLKPFIFAQAFDELPLHPETLMRDEAANFGGYRPQNFDHAYMGLVSVREALQRSLNVPAVAVLDRLGPERFAAMLAAGGARLHYENAAAGPSLPMALGGVGISLQDLAALYTALANGGLAAPLKSLDGAHQGGERRLFSARAAWYVTDILQGSPMPPGLARGAAVARPSIAFKTGTSYGYRDAWAVGYTADYTVAVWVGRPDGSARADQMGRNTAAPLVFKIFDFLPQGADAPQRAPESVLQAANAFKLPAAMQKFDPEAPAGRAGGRLSAITPPRIAFPPDGATIAVGPEAAEAIELRATGGAGPLRWLVNGEFLPVTAALEPTLWAPAGPGFVRLVVVDARGQSAAADVRLKQWQAN